MFDKRSSGVLAHITSLPSRHGIGDLGYPSHLFLDFLVRSQQSYWQFLPINPTCDIFDHSPYMSPSTFAGNPLLISLDLLAEDGYLEDRDISNQPEYNAYTTEFTKVIENKTALLGKAFEAFKNRPARGFRSFIKNALWLRDYCLFMTAKEIFDGKGWFHWPEGFARRDPKTLTDFSAQHKERLLYYSFEQFVFFSQWSVLRSLSRKKGITLFGDLPIYVGYDSADVWSHQNLFTLDPQTLTLTEVSGVPPDYFSSQGQRWGTPLYNWQDPSPNVQNRLFAWWLNRLRHLFSLVDIVRIDHFRGFDSYWAIPADSPSAVNGVWKKGPGLWFFKRLKNHLETVNIVAEDLGVITDSVIQLKNNLGFPGMKVLQFAFDGNPYNPFLPCNFTNPQDIVYTGTHDNDTTLGWFLSDALNDQQRTTIKRLVNKGPSDQTPIHKDLMYLAQSSISRLCIFPLQDILGFGGDCRMNVPGKASGNWRWRCAPEFLTEELAGELAESTRLFGRNRKNENS